MKRIKNAVCGAVAAGLFAVLMQQPVMAANVDGPPVFWKFSVWGKSRALTAGPEHLAARLAEETGGKFQLKIFYGDQLSKAKENLDGMRVNAFEAAIVCNFYHPAKTPALMVMSLPFLPIKDFDTSIAVRDALYQHPVTVSDLEKWNAISYASTHLPQYEFMGTGEPPKTLEDWNGLRVRAGGGVGLAMEKLGAVRQSMPATEVYTALQRGFADAVSFPFTYAHGAYKLHEVASWFTGNLKPGTADCPIVLNKTSYESLPDQYKDLLASLKPEVDEVYREVYGKADERYLPIFQEALTEVTYDPATRQEFQNVAGEPIWRQWVSDNQENFDAQGVLDTVLNAGNGS